LILRDEIRREIRGLEEMKVRGIHEFEKREERIRELLDRLVSRS